MPKVLRYEEKECLGIKTWMEIKDWGLMYVGESQCLDILSTPTVELEKYSWYKIIYDMPIQIPVIKKEYYKDGRKGWNLSNYWMIELNFEFFLERQLRDLMSLGTDLEQANLIAKRVLDWNSERLEVERKLKYQRDAQHLADELGMSVEDVLALIQKQKAPTPLEGQFVMIGNEAFLELEENDNKERYKFNQTILEQLINMEPGMSKAKLKELTGKTYKFHADTETECKSTRRAKGWVKELV